MKKFNKRFLSLMIVMSMLLSPLPAIADKPEVQKSSSTVTANSESDFEFDSAKGEITGYKGNEKDLVIPSKIDGKQVYGLGEGALNQKGLNSVVLPEGMTYLKMGALGKNNLTSVKMPSTMRRIEAYAFVLNKQLKHVELNKGLKSIETFAFSNLPSLSGEIDIPSTVEWIGPKAFFKSNLITLNIKGDENSAPIVLKNALSDHLNYINLENERKDITIDYTAFCNREVKEKVTVTAPINKINITASTAEEVDNWIKNNINIQYATYYVKASDKSGHSDIKNPIDIKWDTKEKFVKDGEFEVTGVMDKESIKYLPEKDGYMLANPDNCQGSNTVSLKFVVKSPAKSETEYEFDSQKGVITKYLGNKKELVIPDEIDGVKVKGIGTFAFAKKNLTSVTLPKYLEFTEYGSFTNNSFNKLEFPDSMKSIGSYSFNNNKNLREVVFNDGLKEIGNHAFIGDKLLSGSLVIPSTVEWIGPSVFRYTNVNKFKIKGGKDSAKLTLKNNLGQEIKEFELEDIQKQLYVDFTSFCNNEKTNLITTENPTEVNVSSPEELEKWIKDNINIQFMSSYQKSGEGSTSQLQKFKTGKYDEYVNIDTVREPIAEFKDNKAIAKAKMQEITDETFPQKPGFIMNKVSNYGGTNTLEFAFNISDKAYEKDNSKYVASDFTYEGSTITGFSETGLKKLETLKNVNLPEKSTEGTVITSIGNAAFKQKGIKSVSIPETVKSIGNLAFQMNELTEIKLPSKLETAGAASFASNKIKEVTIPGTLKEIPDGMFSTNISTKIVIENGVEKIGQSVFTGCKIESLTLPASVKSVGRMAFSGGAKEQTGTLKELILNEGLEKIDTKAFQNNILKEVKIPASLNSIKDDAFKGNAQVVELQTTNEDHLKFNTEKSLKNQKFVLVEDNSLFTASDFTYDGSKITGFSEEGLKKLETYKNVELPEKSSDGTTITTIGKAAFRIKVLNQ
ncbi:MAG: leucine-rich repeat domain-containing protein [Finegoldia magna]|nr:leucine-rich repeat domain-containing protein [Finegoldia magna]